MEGLLEVWKIRKDDQMIFLCCVCAISHCFFPLLLLLFSHKDQSYSEYNSLYFIEYLDLAICSDVPGEYPLASSTNMNNNTERFHEPKFNLSQWKKNGYNKFPDSSLDWKTITLLCWLKSIYCSVVREMSLKTGLELQSCLFCFKRYEKLFFF